MRTSQNTSKRKLGYHAAPYHHPANPPRGGGKGPWISLGSGGLPRWVDAWKECSSPPARRSCLEGSSATVCLVRSSASCASGSRRASTAALRRSCRPCEGGVSLCAGVSGAVGSSSPPADFLELRYGDVLRIYLPRTLVGMEGNEHVRDVQSCLEPSPLERLASPPSAAQL